MLPTKNCASSCARLGSVHQRTSSDGAVGIGIELEPRLTRCWLGLVDLVGIEPTTSSMPWKRAPSCATGPRSAGQLFYCRGSLGDKSISILWRSGSNRRPPRQAGARRCFNLSNQSTLGGPGRDRTDDLPGKPGRASGLLLRVDQHLDRAVRLPTLQLPFAAPCFLNCGELLLIDKDPRASAAGGWRLSALVLCQSSLGIGG